MLITLAARHKLPAVYPLRAFVTGGGLISYGPDSIDPYRSAAGYVDRILKGEKPGDLPVQSPTRYELVINLRAALKETGIEAGLVRIDVRNEAQAARVGFQGSPSIRVNGKDIDGRDEGYAYGCRVYQIDGKITPTPTKEFIEGRLKTLMP